MLIFRSAILYHGVTTWCPLGSIDPNGVFPGRVGYVLYTKQPTAARLVTKPEGYMRRTAYESATAAPNNSLTATESRAPPHKPRGGGEYGVIQQRRRGTTYKRIHFSTDLVPLSQSNPVRRTTTGKRKRGD